MSVNIRNKKESVKVLIVFVILSALLIFFFSRILPAHRALTTIVPLILSGFISNTIRKWFDFIYDLFTGKSVRPYIGISMNVDHASRRFVGYGTSSGDVIYAGYFNADYELEAEKTITIQNQSSETAYEIGVDFLPNEFSKRYLLIDNRENKVQPLLGNQHFEFTLRINKLYYDVASTEVDKDIHSVYLLGRGRSILNGACLKIKFKDSRQKIYCKEEVIE